MLWPSRTWGRRNSSSSSSASARTQVSASTWRGSSRRDSRPGSVTAVSATSAPMFVSARRSG